MPIYQRAPNPPEFAQPRLSRVKARSSPARRYKFGCVSSYMAGHYPGILMTGHIGTNTPKFVPPRWGRQRFDPTQTGLCKFGWVWSALNLCICWRHPYGPEIAKLQVEKPETPGFHKSPPSRPPKTPFKIPNNPPLLVRECLRVHSTMQRCGGERFGGRDGGF